MVLMNPALARASGETTVSISDETKAIALAPYYRDCVYVREAELSYGEWSPTAPIPKDLKVQGAMSIPKSCYIEATGHFNAVEFNICFNQLGYLLFAQSVNMGLMKPFSSWDEDTWKRKQLPDVLIVGMEMTLRKEINASDFMGTTYLHTMKTAKNLVFTKWNVEFSDPKGGFAEGKVLCCTRLL